MAQNVFGHLVPTPPTQEDPVIARDPYKVNEEARKARDQQLQEEANERARADAARASAAAVRAERSDARQQAEFEGTGGKPTEAQQKTSILLARVKKGFADITSVAKENPEAQEPGVVESIRGDLMPGGLSGIPARAIAGEDRRIVHDAQRDVLDALLTLSTGAAYTAEQLSGQMASYFPQYGDTQREIQVKNDRMRSLIASVRENAGPGWAEVESAIAPYVDALNVEIPEGSTVDGGKIYGPDGVFVGVSPGAPDGPMPGGGEPPPGAPPPLGTDSLHQGRPSLYEMQTDPGGYKALATQGATFGLSDELAGVGGFLGAALSGRDPRKGYAEARDTYRMKLDTYRENAPVLGTAAELVGGLATGSAFKAPLSALGFVKQGAGIGALGGFGYGEGMADSAKQAGIGLVGGGALGGIVGRFARPRNALTQEGVDVVAAGERQGIPVRQPDARPDMRGRYAAMESTESAGPMIRAARDADTQAIEARVADVGGGPVTPDNYATGKTIRNAGDRYIARTKAQANALYQRARNAAGDVTVVARNADEALDRNLRELIASGENSNAGAIKYLQGLRSDIDRGLKLESVQNLRTNMRGQISERGLTGTDTDRRVGQVIDAMTQDLAEQLPQEAATALRAADAFYRERQTFINGTLKEFMGSRGSPLDAETASKRLISMAQGKGKFDKFSGMWKQLEPSEQAEIAGQIAASMGRQQNGNFSPAMFIKSLDPAGGINPRTVRLVFGEEGARALSDLRLLAQAKSSAMDRISPSGKAIAAQSGGLKTMLMGALGFGAGGPGGAAAGAVGREFLAKWGEQRAARMLLNPDFTKWLRNAPNTSDPKVIDRYFSKLAGMSSVAANDNQAFTQALISAVRESPRRASAEQSDDGREIPPK